MAKALIKTNEEPHWPEHLAALPNDKQREFVLCYCQEAAGNAAMAAKLAGYGTETSNAASLARIGLRLKNSPAIQGAIITQCQNMLKQEGPAALQAVREIMGSKFHKDQLKAAALVLDRVSPTVQRHEVDVTHHFDPVKITLDLISERRRQGLSRADIMRLEDLSEFEMVHYEKLLAERDGEIIDAEYEEVPAEMEPDPDGLD